MAPTKSCSLQLSPMTDLLRGVWVTWGWLAAILAEDVGKVKLIL